MTHEARWPYVLLGFVLALCVVGLIAYAGGPTHHRGDEVGTHGTKIVVVRPG
jgi:hypothetical protein